MNGFTTPEAKPVSVPCELTALWIPQCYAPRCRSSQRTLVISINWGAGGGGGEGQKSDFNKPPGDPETHTLKFENHQLTHHLF